MKPFAAVVLTCVALGQARAQDLSALEQAAFRAAADRVAPSVVQIETIGGLERVGKLLFGMGPTTGVIVDPRGYIVSSAFNFVNRPASILVRLPDGTRKPARLVATDHSRRLVLLKIEPAGPLPVPAIAPEQEMKIGQWTIALGRAFEVDRPNMAVGILSATGRIWQKALQTDARVSPNHYGGALVDIRGRLMGILVPLSPESDSELAGVNWYDSGIGFAVSAEHVMKILLRLAKGEDLRSGLAGIAFRSRSLQSEEAILKSCRPRSPADKAGLRPGDKLIEIDGRKIERAAHVKEAISRRYAGDKIRVVILREGKRVEAELTLVDKLLPYQRPAIGILPMRAAALAPEPGVTVRWVYPDSTAAKAGLQPGDRLESLDGKPIKDCDGLLEQLAGLETGREVGLEISRGDKKQSIKLRLATLSEDLPPKELPPGRSKTAAKGKRAPGTGTVSIKAGDLPNEVWAYVPEDYDPGAGYGLVVWLQGSNPSDPKELLARWAPHCRRHAVIVVVPKPAQAGTWRTSDVTLVRKLVEQMQSSYTIDGMRIVAGGQDMGGTVALQAAFRHRDLIRAAIAADAPLLGPPEENEPLQPLSFYLIRAGSRLVAPVVTQGIELLREMKFPVTVKDLRSGGLFDPDPLGEIVRWVDMLDRI